MKNRDAETILDEEFLGVRAKLLEVAATLDRIDRACSDSSTLTDSAQEKHGKLMAAVRILLETASTADDSERAEKLQLLFSRPYDADWRQAMHV